MSKNVLIKNISTITLFINNDDMGTRDLSNAIVIVSRAIISGYLYSLATTRPTPLDRVCGRNNYFKMTTIPETVFFTPPCIDRRNRRDMVHTQLFSSVQNFSVCVI